MQLKLTWLIYTIAFYTPERFLQINVNSKEFYWTPSMSTVRTKNTTVANTMSLLLKGLELIGKDNKKVILQQSMISYHDSGNIGCYEI